MMDQVTVAPPNAIGGSSAPSAGAMAPNTPPANTGTAGVGSAGTGATAGTGPLAGSPATGGMGANTAGAGGGAAGSGPAAGAGGGEPPVPAGPDDGDPSAPIFETPDVACGGPGGFTGSANFELGGREMIVTYPCNKHAGAPMIFFLNLHGTTPVNLHFYQHGYFSAHQFAASHNLIVVTPSSVVEQWGNGDNGQDEPHLRPSTVTGSSTSARCGSAATRGAQCTRPRSCASRTWPTRSRAR
jgi:hypothetical protein